MRSSCAASMRLDHKIGVFANAALKRWARMGLLGGLLSGAVALVGLEKAIELDRRLLGALDELPLVLVEGMRLDEVALIVQAKQFDCALRLCSRHADRLERHFRQ